MNLSWFLYGSSILYPAGRKTRLPKENPGEQGENQQQI